MPERLPGVKAHCSCGATAGVEEKSHAKGCPNHPEEQKKGMASFLRKQSRELRQQVLKNLIPGPGPDTIYGASRTVPPYYHAPEARTGIPPALRDRVAGSFAGGQALGQRCGECGRLESWEPTPSWSTCPCGKPARPGNDTRTNAYRGDELVEVRYPHEGGASCVWTREKRR